MIDNIKWLTTVPVTYGNFRSHLQKATIDEIKEALSIMTGTGVKGNASRIATLSKELRKREKKK